MKSCYNGVVMLKVCNGTGQAVDAGLGGEKVKSKEETISTYINEISTELI
jgi:hypothetical protein